MAKELRPGYILHADSAWVDYHLAHSVGRDFGYTRGFGAPFQNVVGGGTVFFIRRGERVKHVAFWGHFVEDLETTPQQAWAQLGAALGAPTYDSWMEESLAFIDELTSVTPIRVLHFSNLTVPHEPIPMLSAGVEVVPRATKGWSIGAEDVDQLLRFDNRLLIPPDLGEDDPGNEEGRRRLQTHYRIERNRLVVERAKSRWLGTDPALRCSCCPMSFTEMYGERGRGFIEAHHITPLADLVDGEIIRTKIEDLAPVCSNCHRMLHRRPHLSVAELRNAIVELRKAHA